MQGDRRWGSPRRRFPAGARTAVSAAIDIQPDLAVPRSPALERLPAHCLEDAFGGAVDGASRRPGALALSSSLCPRQISPYDDRQPSASASLLM